MLIDIRYEAAKYYDHTPSPFDGQDIRFYLELLQAYPKGKARVLELGCGTGRVLLPFTAHCAYIHGIDLSEAMLDLCRAKLAKAGVPVERASVQHGDITRLDLGQKFDLITAPFRVMQNLETDEQLDGLFNTIRRHLAPGGSCVLNAFRPWGDEALVRQKWASRQEELMTWETPVGNGRVACFDSVQRVHPTKFICYPRLIYRYYEVDEVKDEAVLDIAMHAYTPEDFERLIIDHGFRVLDKRGGYNNEVYGEGPELVVRFSL